MPSQALDRFLLELDDATRRLSEPSDIIQASATLLGRHLNVDRCAYAEVEADEDTMNLTGNYRRSDAVKSIVGRLRFRDFGAEVLQLMRDDRPYVVHDVETHQPPVGTLDAYRATQIRAVICVPLHKRGAFVAAMAVHTMTPRRWQPEEVELVLAVASRCWESLERSRVTRDLESSEMRFRALVNATSDIVYQMSPDWSEMRHLQGRDFIEDTTDPSRTWSEKYILPDDRGLVQRTLADAIRRRCTFELEHRVRRVDGSVGWVFSRAVPLLDERGEIREWFGAASDITARKEAEEAAATRKSEGEKQRRLYEAILTNTPDFAYIFDLDHRFIYVNEALLKAWGRTWEEAIGRTCLELGYPQWHAEMHDRDIETVVSTRRPIRGEVPFTAPGTGGRRVYDYFFVPVFGPDGSVEAVAGTTRDVTELREAHRRKDEFIATLSHELRNPLAPLRNALHLLRMGGPGAPAAQVHEMMERQVNHLIRLVDDLLEVSRITRGALELRKEPLEVAAVAKIAVETSDPHIQAARQRLTVSLPAQPLWIDGDPVRLAQIVSNLLNNAARYTDQGGSITLEAVREDKWAVIRVRDNGAGIAPDKLPRLFEMFSRGAEAAARSPGGLGVGLALAKGLAEMHGGTVHAHSDGLGKGSTFSVRLPLIPPPAERRDANSAGMPRFAGPILVVDDNRDAADSLAMLLTVLGAEVRVALGAKECLEAYARCRPRVVLLDIGMPGMDGYEVARRLRAQHPGDRAALVALTGWGQEEDRRKARDAGFDHHLVKPADIGALQGLLASLAERS